MLESEGQFHQNNGADSEMRQISGNNRPSINASQSEVPDHIVHQTPSDKEYAQGFDEEAAGDRNLQTQKREYLFR